MNKEEVYWSKLKDYAEGNLAEEESAEIKVWLESEEDAQTVIAGYRQIKEEIPDQNDRNKYYQKQVENTIASLERRTYRLPQRFLVAASLLIIGGLVAYLFLKNPPPEASFNELLADYTNEYYTAPFTTRNGEEKPADWVLAYQNKDFIAVINHLGNIDRNSPRETFYLGMAYFYTSDYEQAGMYLQDKTLENTLFIEQSKWYLALCYLQLEEYEAGVILLEDIINKKTYRHEEAQVLVAQLDSND